MYVFFSQGSYKKLLNYIKKCSGREASASVRCESGRPLFLFVVGKIFCSKNV